MAAPRAPGGTSKFLIAERQLNLLKWINRKSQCPRTTMLTKSDALDDAMDCTGNHVSVAKHPGTAGQALTDHVVMIGHILLMVAAPIAGWFLWSWGMPRIWPSGPASVIEPGLWLFIGVSVLARAAWCIGFLCPKSESA
jgi:hypothetical protein